MTQNILQTTSQKVYDTDNIEDYQALLKMRDGKTPQVYPRRSVYGTQAAFDIGLTPVDAVPDVLLPKDEWEGRLKEAHDLQNLPIYHMYDTWRPKGYQYNQNGLGFCWTWSATGCLMTTRAMESKDTVKLAPVSMGYLVGWANRGNYLESVIEGLRKDGVCPAVDGDVNSLNRNASYWAQFAEQRKLYRLDKVWDTNSSNMTQHCVSILYYGRSLHIAYNWWSHALELVGIRMVNGILQWDISNSHNEADVITLTGSKAIPDEAYGFISTVLT